MYFSSPTNWERWREVSIHEFPIRSGIAEESLIYDNLLKNKRITKQYRCYMPIVWKNTHFKLVQNEGLNKLG